MNSPDDRNDFPAALVVDLGPSALEAARDALQADEDAEEIQMWKEREERYQEGEENFRSEQDDLKQQAIAEGRALFEATKD